MKHKVGALCSSSKRRRWRIVAVIPSLARGGAERMFALLTLEWEKWFDVVAVVFDGSRDEYTCGGKLVDFKLQIGARPLGKASVAATAVKHLVRLLRAKRPDLIVSFMEPASLPTTVAAALCGALPRLTVTVRNNPASLSLARRIAIRLFYRAVGRIVAPSRGVRHVLERMGLPGRKLFTIENPVVPREMSCPAPRTPVPFRFILGAGRLHRQKGFDRLLEAFADYDRLDIHLVILGEGKERDSLKELATKLGISDRVHFPGAVEEIDLWYQSAECFVLSSRYEGWPNVLMEAMANGCPVVSFGCRYGPSEMIETFRNGVLVPEGDIDQLREAMAEVVEDRVLRQRLADGGRQTAAGFHPEKIAARWIAGR